MHTKHRISIGAIFLATSIILPSSLTGLKANEANSRKPASRKAPGLHVTEDLPVVSDSSEKKAARSSGNTTGVRFLIAEGKASYYANRFHGQRTASGEHFDRMDYTAAHRSLPFGTKVRVTNLANGRQVLVKVNDRGPHMKNRIIDISQAAAREIGINDHGIGNVRIEAYN
jgi:rare lipoprotein A